MPRRYLKFAKGHFYHVYNRGANKQKIFYQCENYLYLLGLLRKNAEEFMIAVVAYCLMPNHYHFLLRVDGDSELSRCVSITWNTYVQAFNKRFNRSGPLFSERFRAIHVDKDNYLVHLCRYIHLNPLKANLVRKLEQWPFSNYLEFIGKRKGSLFDSIFFQAYFADPREYYDFVHDESMEPPTDFDKYTFDYL